jgi:hypothetical protein
VSASLLFATLLLPRTALAECGPWDGTPYCTRDPNWGGGAGITRVHRFLDGYSVCYHGDGIVCRGGAWVTSPIKSCIGRPDDPSPMPPTDRPCSNADLTVSEDSGGQANANPNGGSKDSNRGAGTRRSTPGGGPNLSAYPTIGKTVATDSQDDLPPPGPRIPIPPFSVGARGPVPQPGRSQAGASNSAACAQTRAQIQQIRANCVAMSATGGCADPGKLSLIQQLQNALAANNCP